MLHFIRHSIILFEYSAILFPSQTQVNRSKEPNSYDNYLIMLDRPKKLRKVELDLILSRQGQLVIIRVIKKLKSLFIIQTYLITLSSRKLKWNYNSTIEIWLNLIPLTFCLFRIIFCHEMNRSNRSNFEFRGNSIKLKNFVLFWDR